MKYLLIGGSGFVGTRLIEELGKENCINIDKVTSEFFPEITIIHDITSKLEFKRDFNDIDHVILLAAEHKDNISPVKKYYDVNVSGTLNVLSFMDENNLDSLIFTSSVAVYGLNKLYPNENTNPHPFNHYGKSKLEAEMVIEKWYNNSNQKKMISIIRPTVIFGERNRGNVYNLFKQIASGKFLMVGDGRNKKSMAYVGNVCAFIVEISKINNSFQIYNYSDKPDFTMNDLVILIEKTMKIKVPSLKIPIWIATIAGYFFDLFSLILRKKLSVSSVRIKKFCAVTQFDSSKANKYFKPKVSLEEAVKKTLKYEFINKNKDNRVFYSE